MQKWHFSLPPGKLNRFMNTTQLTPRWTSGGLHLELVADVHLYAQGLAKACTKCAFNRQVCRKVCNGRFSLFLKNLRFLVDITVPPGEPPAFKVDVRVDMPAVVIKGCAFNRGILLNVAAVFLGPIETIVKNRIRNKVQELAQSVSREIAVPQTYTHHGMTVDFFTRRFRFVADKYLTFEVAATLTLDVAGRKYGFPEVQEYANALPPKTWSPSELHLPGRRKIFEIRLSASFLRAISWAAHLQGAFNISHSENLMDAVVNITASFAPAETKVLNKGVLQLSMQSGQASFRCQDPPAATKCWLLRSPT